LVIGAAVAVLGLLGSGQARAGERVLGSLDPAIDSIRVAGGAVTRGMVEHPMVVCAAVSIVAALVWLGGAAAAGRSAAPLGLMCVGAASAAWGQACLLGGRFVLGAMLYGCGAVCAFGLGRICPMTRLRGFPDRPAGSNGGASGAPKEVAAEAASGGPASGSQRGDPQPEPGIGGRSGLSSSAAYRLEWLVVAAVSVLGLVTREYGLTELPTGFDNELIESMIWTRTWHGVVSFIGETFADASVGFAHVPVQVLAHRVFGTSTFSIRMASVVWGTATIPLFYLLVRRIAGVAPAVLGSVLFALAPEQLFWSRIEDGHFAPMIFYAVVAGLLSLRIARRPTWTSAIAAALWISVATFFYTPCLTLTALPAAAWVHATLVGRRGWRSARRVLPVLAVGLLLLWFGKSLVIFVNRDAGWRFYSPLQVHGNVAWKAHMADDDPSAMDVVGNLIGTATANLGKVVRDATVENLDATHWCQREIFGSGPAPSVNVAIAALVVLGVAYLLGQPRDPRAAILLIWVVLGLLPGLFSDGPSPRRIGTVFPAVIAIVAVQLAVFWRTARVASGARMERVVGGLVVLLVGVIAMTNLVSHLRLPMAPILTDEIGTFIRPELEASDTVFHTFERGIGRTVFYTQLDRLVSTGRPCLDTLDRTTWPRAAVAPDCRFEEIYSLLMAPDDLAEMQRAFEPGDTSFVLHDPQGESPYLAPLLALYPPGVSTIRSLDCGEFGEVMVVRVPAAAMAEKRGPLVTTMGAAEAPGGADRRSGSRVRGAILLPHDDWYHFRVRSPVGAGPLRINGQPASWAEQLPLLAGAHLFDLDLPAGSETTGELEVEVGGQRAAASWAVSSDDLTHPEVAAIPGVRAPSCAVVEGFSARRRIAAIEGLPCDLGVDAAGRLFVLAQVRGVYTVSRLSPAGVEEARWSPPVEQNHQVSLAVDRNGVVLVVGRRELLFFDADGRLLRSAPIGFFEPALDAAFTNDGRIVLSLNEHNSVELFDATGRHLASVVDLGDPSQPLYRPLGVAVSPDDRLLVVEENGRGLVFDVADAARPPRFERVFDTDMLPPIDSRGCAFDGRRLVAIPNRNDESARIYDSEGHRAIARIEARDLVAQLLRHPMAFARHGGTLYVLDQGDGGLVALDAADPSAIQGGSAPPP